VVLQAFLVNHRGGGAVVCMVALQDPVGERHRLWTGIRVSGGLVDPGGSLDVEFRRFGGGVCGSDGCWWWRWCYYLHPLNNKNNQKN